MANIIFQFNNYLFLFFTAVNCGTLTNPANGQVTHTAGATFGQTATYSCNTGYNLVGSSTRTCQATRVWSGSAPTCPGVYFVELSTKSCYYINLSETRWIVSTCNILNIIMQYLNKCGVITLITYLST